jgi:DNA-binding transcriptional LysR family regulator
MDLTDLPLFSAVAEAKSFSAAARRLGLPKSSVSRGVARLEQQLGVRLLQRTTRQVSLSSAGAELFRRVTPLLAELEASLSQVPELEAEPSGVLRVTAPLDLGMVVLPRLVVEFSARYPAVTVEMRLTNAVLDLAREGMDVAIRISLHKLKDSSLNARKIGTIKANLYAAPSYLEQAPPLRSSGDLASHRWVVFRPHGPLRLVGPGVPIRIATQGRIVCDDMSFARSAVAAGAGIGVLPSFIANADVEAGRLVRVLPRYSLPTGHVWLAYPGAQAPRKLTAFRDFLLEALPANLP